MDVMAGLLLGFTLHNYYNARETKQFKIWEHTTLHSLSNRNGDGEMGAM